MFKFEILGYSRDCNGNRTIKIKPLNGRGFSIQTNGNLPLCHAFAGRKNDFKIVHYDEVLDFITKHGTSKQKAAICG